MTEGLNRLLPMFEPPQEEILLENPVVASRIDLRLELKQDLYQKPPLCPDCDDRPYKRNGFLYPKLHPQSQMIYKNPEAFMQQLLRGPSSLQLRWRKIAALTILYRHPEAEEMHEPLTLRYGPDSRIGVWARPYLMALYVMGVPIGQMRKIIKSCFGLPHSYTAIELTAAGMNPEERFRREMLEEFHIKNTDKMTFVSGGWATNVPPIAWETILRGEITEQTRLTLSHISMGSRTRPRQGTLSFSSNSLSVT